MQNARVSLGNVSICLAAVRRCEVTQDTASIRSIVVRSRNANRAGLLAETDPIRVLCVVPRYGSGELLESVADLNVLPSVTLASSR